MFKKLFVLLIISLVVYAGVVFIPPFYHYYAFKDDIKELAMIGRAIPTSELMQKVMEKANDYNIPIDESDVTITGGKDKRIDIAIEWQERVNFLNIYERSFSFSVDTSRE